MLRTLLTLVYLGIGLVVAGDHNYLDNFNDLAAVASAVLGVVLWPLVLLGVDLHIGHLVIATMHTTDVAETVNRIVDFFPSHQQKQVRVALAGSLAGVITQRLLTRIGGGRAPAIEIMIMNGRIRDCILDPDRTHEILDIVAQSQHYGMQTFDQALIKLYQDGSVRLEDAKAAATNPHDFQLALQKAGALDI